MQYDDALTCKP